MRRLFGSALLLYPERFRRRYADDMLELFDDLSREARRRHGRSGEIGVALRALAAVPAGAARAWSAERARRRRPQLPRARRVKMVPSFASDLIGAVRGLRRAPGFALMAVGSLALGMAANGSLLTLVQGLVWSELPVREPQRLLRVFQRDSRGPGNFSYANYRDLVAQGADVFESALVHDLASFGLRRGGSTEVIHGELVSSNYFDVLGVRPAAGRLFAGPDADDRAAEPLAVISTLLWQTRFAGDPAVVGSLAELSGVPVRVVGVAPASFQGTKLGLGMDVWVTLLPWAQAQGLGAVEERRGGRWLNVVARLAPGRTRQDAQAAADTIAERLAAEYPETNRHTGFALTGEAAGSFGGHGERLTRTIGGVAVLVACLVLLVACGNVAALLLARGAVRQREMAIRRALGAGRGRILRHFLAESLMISAAATLLGLALARFASPLTRLALPPLPYRFALPTAPDGRVLALMALGGVLTALVCGLAPAVYALRALPGAARRSQASAPGRLRPLALLSGLTLAFCCVTLVLGGLFARSLGAARAVQPGFQTAGRATASVDVGLAGPGATSPDRYYAALLAELERLPGASGVAVASNLPLTDRQSTWDVFDAARPAGPDDVGVEAWSAAVSESYFEVMGQPLLAGRSFASGDRVGPAVAILSRELAARLGFDPAAAVGRQVRSGDTQLEVVGVAGDARYGLISEATRPALYTPFWPDPPQRAEIVLRGRDADAGLELRIAEAGRRVDPRVPVFGAKPLAVHVSGSLWMFRLAAGLAAGVGLLAAGLALAGLYGVMAWSAQQRRTEIGIRMALGASRNRVLATLLAGGLRLTLLGVGAGLLAAAAAAQLARSIVVGVSPHDPLAFGAAGALVTGFALAACLAPSLGAARADPSRALRAE